MSGRAAASVVLIGDGDRAVVHSAAAGSVPNPRSRSCAVTPHSRSTTRARCAAYSVDGPAGAGGPATVRTALQRCRRRAAAHHAAPSTAVSRRIAHRHHRRTSPPSWSRLPVTTSTSTTDAGGAARRRGRLGARRARPVPAIGGRASADLVAEFRWRRLRGRWTSTWFCTTSRRGHGGARCQVRRAVGGAHRPERPSAARRRPPSAVPPGWEARGLVVHPPDGAEVSAATTDPRVTRTTLDRLPRALGWRDQPRVARSLDGGRRSASLYPCGEAGRPKAPRPRKPRLVDAFDEREQARARFERSSELSRRLGDIAGEIANHRKLSEILFAKAARMAANSARAVISPRAVRESATAQHRRDRAMIAASRATRNDPSARHQPHATPPSTTAHAQQHATPQSASKPKRTPPQQHSNTHTASAHNKRKPFYHATAHTHTHHIPPHHQSTPAIRKPHHPPASQPANNQHTTHLTHHKTKPHTTHNKPPQKKNTQKTPPNQQQTPSARPHRIA